MDSSPAAVIDAMARLREQKLRELARLKLEASAKIAQHSKGLFVIIKSELEKHRQIEAKRNDGGLTRRCDDLIKEVDGILQMPAQETLWWPLAFTAYHNYVCLVHDGSWEFTRLTEKTIDGLDAGANSSRERGNSTRLLVKTSCLRLNAKGVTGTSLKAPAVLDDISAEINKRGSNENTPSERTVQRYIKALKNAGEIQ